MVASSGMALTGSAMWKVQLWTCIQNVEDWILHIKFLQGCLKKMLFVGTQLLQAVCRMGNQRRPFIFSVKWGWKE
uniref:Uncharacterized protein n=1 Tax=Rhizophora mucronata TaxID=61149 RepID=A0A2P2NZ71_RHIMU